jgi:phosphosulfolactate synthase
METTVQTDWRPSLLDPSGIRLNKPRQSGRTMIMDKGIGLNAFEDMLETSAPYIDLIKFGFGTSPLYPLKLLERKIELARAHDLIVYPGGTFLEVAVAKQELPAFFEMIRRVGFSGLEVSDGTIDMSRSLRNDLIERGREMGLFVVTEYGKKAHGSTIEIDSLFNTIHQDIEYGAEIIIVEARESGCGVGLFDDRGDCREDTLTDIIERLHNLDRIMWEAPLKHQQVQLLNVLGSSVNLGNISSDEILSLECLRRGLRADTFYHS